MRFRTLCVISSLFVGALAPVLNASPASAKDKFCSDLPAVDKQLAAVSAAADAKALAKSLTDFAAILAKTKGRVPGVIKADWKKMISGTNQMSNLMNKMNKLTVAQMSKESPKIQAEMDKLNADKSYSVSSDKISVWAKKNCSITLG